MVADKAPLAPSMSFATLPGVAAPGIERVKVGGDAVDELSHQLAAETLGARLIQTADSLAIEEETKDAFPLTLSSDRSSNRMSFSFSSSVSQSTPAIRSSNDLHRPANPAAPADPNSSIGSSSTANDGRSSSNAAEGLKEFQAPVPSPARAAYETYQSLAADAHKCFLRLRDLPFAGRQPWTVVYQEAFAAYSKLWGLQQEQRQALVNQGLTRWEIGDVASRIGQLYYSYYIRTADVSYLYESFIFYEAVARRDYFREAARMNADVARKQLRYAMRFAAVCLLLGRKEALKKLIWKMRWQVDEFGRNFQPPDLPAWQQTVCDVVSFARLERSIPPLRSLRYAVLVDPPPAALPPVAVLQPVTAPSPLSLCDVILASCHRDEVVFNDLSIDTFRMMQALEYLPSGFLQQSRTGEVTSSGVTASGGAGAGASSAGAPGSSGSSSSTAAAVIAEHHHQQQQLLGHRVGGSEENLVDPSLPPNPHKYVLSSPSVLHFLHVLSTAVSELPADGALLVYLSADKQRRWRDGSAGTAPSPQPPSPLPQSSLQQHQELQQQLKRLQDGVWLRPPPPPPTPAPPSTLPSESSESKSTAGDAQQVRQARGTVDRESGMPPPVFSRDASDSNPGADAGSSVKEGVGSLFKHGGGEVKGTSGVPGIRAVGGIGSVGGTEHSAAQVGHGGEEIGDGRETADLLTAADLMPFTRRPMMLVVDGDNSGAFQALNTHHLDGPVVMLMSAVRQPSKAQRTSLSSSASALDLSHSGSTTSTTSNRNVPSGGASGSKADSSHLRRLSVDAPYGWGDASASASAGQQAHSASPPASQAGSEAAPAAGAPALVTVDAADAPSTAAAAAAAAAAVKGSIVGGRGALARSSSARHAAGVAPGSNAGLRATDSETSSGGSSAGWECAGGALTSFLTSPLAALAWLADVPRDAFTQSQWESFECQLSMLLSAWASSLSADSSLSLSWARMLLDPFLRRLVMRFIFCRALFALHKDFTGDPSCQPSCSPGLPTCVSPNSHVIISGIRQLTSALNISQLFNIN